MDNNIIYKKYCKLYLMLNLSDNKEINNIVSTYRKILLQESPKITPHFDIFNNIF